MRKGSIVVVVVVAQSAAAAAAAASIWITCRGCDDCWGGSVVLAVAMDAGVVVVVVVVVGVVSSNVTTAPAPAIPGFPRDPPSNVM